MPSQTAPVVIGYDGSPAGRAALHWATAEAVRQHVPLRIVEVFELVVEMHPSAGTVVPLAVLRTNREQGLAALAESIRLQYPHLEVVPVLLEGTPAAALLEETGQARMVVLGSRGLGGWTGLLVGSVAVQVSTHAQCPVVVVPPDVRPRAHGKPAIVVGVDGSKTSAKAIDFAFDQAEARGAKVVAVHAWTSPYSTDADGQETLLFDEHEVEEARRVLVSESLAGAAADHPDVEHEVKLMSGQAARALVLTAESADLVVVGSRGRGGFTGLLLGSVSQGVLHHAPCPVAIVR